MSHDPHDGFFRLIFGDVENTRGFLEVFLPHGAREGLDLSQLRPADAALVGEKLGRRSPDLLFSVPSRSAPAEVHLIFEHQSKTQRLVPFRLLRGAVLRWDALMRQRRPPQRLPAIVPILVAQTGHRWTQREGMDGLWDLEPALFEALRPHLPAFRPLLVDLAALPEEQLGGTAAGQLALRLLKHSRSGRLWQLLPAWRGLIQSLSPATLQPMLSYILRVSGPPEQGALEAALPPEIVEQAMTEGQLFWKKVAADARQEGKLEGKLEGRLEGKLEGKLEGLEEGKALGTAAALTLLLEHRHGPLRPDLRDRIAAAGPLQLSAWLIGAAEGRLPEELLGLPH